MRILQLTGVGGGEGADAWKPPTLAPAKIDDGLGVFMTQPFIDLELEALVPSPFAIRPDESDKPAGTLPAHFGHDGKAVADANLEQFVRSVGVGTIVVSAGPWNEGAVVDGCRRFRLAEQLGLKPHKDYAIQERTFTSAMEAKRFRWEANVSTQRRVPYFLFVRSFLMDDDFKAYFDSLAAEGRKRMREGGRKGGKAKGKASSDTTDTATATATEAATETALKLKERGFDRRLVSARYCNVAPWQFYYSQQVYRWQLNPSRYFPKKFMHNVNTWIRKADIGEKDGRAVYLHLKNMARRMRRKKKLDIGAATQNSIAASSTPNGDLQLIPTAVDTAAETAINTVYHGNCLDIMKQMPTESVDRIATSPFYFVPKLKYGEGWVGPRTWTEYVAFTRDWIDEAWRILKPWGVLVVNVDSMREDHELAKADGRKLRHTFDHMYEIKKHLESAHGCRVWEDKFWTKKNIAGKASARGSDEHPNNRPNCEIVTFFFKGHRDHEEIIPTADPREICDWTMSTWDILPENMKPYHPAPFPKELARRMVGYGGSLDDVVLDPFSGTGTTLEAAAEAGMSYIGIELNSEWAACSKAAGEKALRERMRMNEEAELAMRGKRSDW